MVLSGLNYFSGGLFSSSTGTAVRYFTDGLFVRDITDQGLVPIFVDGLLATAAANLTAERFFSFGLFSGAILVESGPELLWAHILQSKERAGQGLPL
jgi:hypothetical protein